MITDLTDKEARDTGISFPKLGLRLNEVARICILTPKKVEVSLTHWVTGLGYVHCHAVKNAKSSAELLRIETEGGCPEECPLCQMVSKGNSVVSSCSRRFVLPVLRYRTDMEGKIIGNADFYLEIWLFNNEKYRNLKRLAEEWGDLRKHDLALTCSSAEYQKMAIDLQKSALWMKRKDEVFKFWKEEIEKYPLKDCLGHEMSKEVLKRRFLAIERRGLPEEKIGLDEGDVLAEDTKADSNALVDDFKFPGDDEEASKGKVPEVVDKKEKEDKGFLDLDNFLEED